MEGLIVASLMFISGAYVYWAREFLCTLKEIQKLLEEMKNK